VSPAHADEVTLAGERPRRPAGQRTGGVGVAERGQRDRESPAAQIRSITRWKPNIE
jgi:hypothetical protein